MGASAAGTALVLAAKPSAGGNEAPQAAPVPTEQAVSQGAMASAVGGGCSISQAAPGSGMIVAAAGAPAHVGGSGAVDDAETVEASKAQPRAPQQISDLMDEPVAEVAVAKPVTAIAPARRAKPRAVPDSAKKVWWPAPMSGKLNLTYAGEAAFTGAIALLFDGAFENTDSVNRNIEVKDRRGRAVKGTWLVSTNRQMVLFGAAPGLYSISLGTGLADKGGRTLSASSEGHVFVR